MLLGLLRKLVQSKRSDPVAQARLQGRKLQYQRNFSAALRTLEAALPSAGDARLQADLLIEQGLCLLRMGRFADAQERFNRAKAIFPQHRLIDQLAIFPRLMTRSLPIARKVLDPMRIAMSPPGNRKKLLAVYFFLQTASTTPQSRDGYGALMSQSVSSARSCIPEVSSVLLTDQVTQVPRAQIFDRIERMDLDAGELVYSRLLAVSRFLAEVEEGADIALLDPDTKIERNFLHVFATEFDLALTSRSDFADVPMDHEPFNVGVILIRHGSAQRAKRFFDLCIEHFEETEKQESVRTLYPDGLRQWRGDQVLPAAVVGWSHYIEHVLSGQTNALEIDGTKLLFLESKDFNHPSGAKSDSSGPYIRHYKGKEKAAMLRPAKAAGR
jgi:tetratricopeptide (TPR) repeat protein